MKPEYAEAFFRKPVGLDVTIVNCFDTYEHRADLLKKIFQNAGCQVRVCTSDFRHIEKIQRQETKSGYHFFAAEPYYRNISLRRMYSHKQLSRNVFSYVERYVKEHQNRKHLLWVFVPPNSFVKDAASIKHAYPQIRLVFDILDLWPETIPAGWVKGLPLFKEWKGLRDKHLYDADGIVTECNLYRIVLRDVLGGGRKIWCGHRRFCAGDSANGRERKKVFTLYLARPLLPYQIKLNLPEGALSLCYLGSVNHVIDIRVITDIIRKCRRQMPVILHVIGSGEKKDELCSKARKAGARIVDHGIVYDRETKQQIFAACHYGLNIMKKSVCVGLTMKSMDYLEAGLPLINNIPGDTWSAVRKYGIGINYNEGIPDMDLSGNQEKRKNARRFFEQNLSEEVFQRKALDIAGHVSTEIKM